MIKEPPYSVRESGYAGFNLPIDIYFRNNEEPKKVRFNYDLNLQTTGPTICKVQKEKYVFNNPTEEVRHKLVKAGGYIINSDNSRDISSSSDKQQLINKSKSASSSDILKKHRVKEHKQEDSFTDLFGTPITKTSKVSPDAKIPSKTSPTNIPLKPDKSSNPKKSKSKHSPKEKDRDKEKKDKSQEKKHKEEKKSKERSKDKERKDKGLKRERSPMQQSASPIRSPKRPPSPKRIPSPKRPPSPPVKVKSDEKKSDEPSKEKIKTESKKSKHEQKEKEKDKEKKEHKSHKDKDAANRNSEPQKEHKIIKEPKPPKEQIPYMIKEKPVKPVEETLTREPEKVEKQKVDKLLEPEKQKHKHKKKDSKEKREKKEEKSREKKAEKKSEKTDGFFEKVYKDEVKESPKDIEKNLVNSKPVEPILDKNSIREKSRALCALQAELNDDSSSSSVVTHDESSIEVPAKPPPPPPPSVTAPVVEKLEQSKKSKDKTKSDGSLEKKRKRKHESSVKEEPQVKMNEEPSPKITRDEPDYTPKQSESNINKKETISSSAAATADVNQDYMSILKELQHKIMTLQDNDELQRVVQLIAETGQFEITAQTFDFDLCALDRDTVRRLQEFFALS